MSDLDALFTALGYCFRDTQLAHTALSHPSYAHERDGSRGNERLEDQAVGSSIVSGLVVAGEHAADATPGKVG